MSFWAPLSPFSCDCAFYLLKSVVFKPQKGSFKPTTNTYGRKKTFLRSPKMLRPEQASTGLSSTSNQVPIRN